MSTSTKLEKLNERWYGRQIIECINRNNFNGLIDFLSKTNVGLDYLDEFANTPFLYACYLGRCHFVKFLSDCGANVQRINIYGQNALALATYSGDLRTCQTVVDLWGFSNYNQTSILTPLCVAVLTNNYAIAEFYIHFENPTNGCTNNCPSKSMHGVCPLELAKLQSNQNIIELLMPTHGQHCNN